MKYADRKNKVRWKSPIDKIADVHMQEKKERDPEMGSDNPRYLLCVDEDERGYILDLLNPETAYVELVSMIPEYLGDYGGECGLPPGLYQTTIYINGSGPDIHGEYESWLVYTDIKVYELKDEYLVDFEEKTVEQL